MAVFASIQYAIVVLVVLLFARLDDVAFFRLALASGHVLRALLVLALQCLLGHGLRRLLHSIHAPGRLVK